MKITALKFLVCPKCKMDLDLQVRAERGPEVLDGILSCRGCKAQYPIVAGVPRFVRAGAYASSFGKQWNWFQRWCSTRESAPAGSLRS